MWHFSQDQSDGDFYVENGNYGNPGCVIFRAAGIGTISAGDSFIVSIENRSDYTVLRYTVTFFDL